MTASLIALLAVVGAPSDAELQARVVGAGVRVGLLPGEAGDLSEPVGAGMGVRIRVRPPSRGSFVGEIAVEHDRFGRTVAVEVELEDERGLPSGERIELFRAQRLTLTRMLAGVGWAPQGRRVQGRVAVMGGAALAFFLHPGANPTSVSRWKALARADAAVAVKVVRRTWVELSVEWNVLGPDSEEEMDFGAPGGAKGVRPFGDYGVAGVSALYAF